MRRLAPALALFFLAPLVAEFFLGDFPVALLFLVIPFAPMYGGAALLIRELARRTGRGWPTMVLLALAFGVLEEGLLTQSLFNKDYVDAHLLDDGFVPALGIAIPWTIFVLTIHAVWSISTPVALVEESTRSRRTQPWLRWRGIIVTAVLFLLGCAFTFGVSYGNGRYLAPAPQLVGSAVVVLVLVVAAFLLPRGTRSAHTVPGRVPGAWWVFAGTLVAGLLFMGLTLTPIPWGIEVAIGVLVLAVVAVTVALLARREGWGRWHRYALAAGALLTYSWHAFTMGSVAGATRVLDLVSHVIYAFGALAILWYARRRVAHPDPAVDEAPAGGGQPARSVAS
jgi:hypothetical protein